MKKKLVFITLLITFGVIFAQNTLNEGFENTNFPPDGWSVEMGSWDYDNVFPHTGNYCAWIGMMDNTDASGHLVTPKLSIQTGDQLTFWGRKMGFSATYIEVQYSTNSSYWTTLETVEFGMGYTEFTVDLSSIPGDYYLAFYKGDSGEAFLDDVTGPAFASDNGSVGGGVYDAPNFTPIAGATISIDGTIMATTTTSGLYSFDLPAGTYDLTCETNGYIPQTQSAEITAGGLTYCDFYMQPLPLPGFVEDFESGIFPPAGWTNDDQCWIADSMLPYEGNTCAYINFGMSGRLVTPLLEIETGDVLSFYARDGGVSQFEIQYSSDGVLWTVLQSIDVASSYTEYVVDLSSIPGQYYLGFYKGIDTALRLDLVSGPDIAATTAQVEGNVFYLNGVIPMNIANADIFCDGTWVATTNDNGNYNFEVESGQHEIACCASGFTPMNVQQELTSGLNTIDFMMDPTTLGYVSGLVYYLNGTLQVGIANAEIYCGNELLTTTDANGEFSFDYESGIHQFTCYAAGYQDVTNEVEIEAGMNIYVPFQMNAVATGTVDGNVFYIENGNQFFISNAQILCDNNLMATSDYTGYFSFEIAPGSYQLECVAAGFCTQSNPLVITAGEILNIQIEMEPVTTGTVNGQAFYLIGTYPEGIEGAEVYCANELLAVSDENGYFSFEYEAGTYNFDCFADYYEDISLETTVIAGELTYLSFMMQPVTTGTLQGHVYYPDGQLLMPLENAELYGDDILIATSDADGFYSCELDPGNYAITATAPGYTQSVENVIIVLDQTTVQDFVLGQLANSNENLIAKAALIGNYPNPFNPQTIISFSTTESTNNTQICVYNLKGQKVKQLVNAQFSAGQHSVVWNGIDDAGKPVVSGVYLYKMKSGNYQLTRKMILLK